MSLWQTLWEPANPSSATGSVEGDTHAASSKTTPVDADELPVVNSAASFALAKVTWANLKATLAGTFAKLAGTTGGQTLIGGTGVTDALSLQGTSGNGTAGSAAINLNVGNNGATVAMTVLNGGGVGVGTLSPLTTLTVAETSMASPRGILSQQFSTSVNGARVGFSKARGSVATPTTVVSGDGLGRLMFRGFDGTNYLEMGSIEMVCTGTIATGRIPTYLSFLTATDAATSVLTEAMRINSDQSITVGTLTVNALLIQSQLMSSIQFGAL
jgi:hypothetical protein